MDNVLSGQSTGLLVFPLNGHGLAALPSSLAEKISMDAQVALHCLLLTWLTVQASEDYFSSSLMTEQDRNEYLKPPIFGTFPFKIASVQLTFLHGNPSIFVAIQERSNRIAESISVAGNVFFKTVEAFLTDTNLKKALEPLILHESTFATKLLSSLPDLLRLPLHTFLTFQDDTFPLTAPISFYWCSSYLPSCLPSLESLVTQNTPTTTVFTLNCTSLTDPTLVLSIFQKVFLNGLNIAGIRTIYGKTEGSLLYDTIPRKATSSAHLSMTLAVALRGPNAILCWKDVMGSQDETFSKVIDSFSLTVKFGSNRLCTLTTANWSSAALAEWFGGRACLKTCSVVGMTDPYTKSERRKRQRVRFSETQSESEDSVSSPFTELSFPPLISNLPRLTVHTYTKSLLTVSPNVPPSCYGSILASCNQLGFDIFGARRIRLNAKRAAAVGIEGEFLTHYAPSSTPPSPLLLSESSNPLSSAPVKQLLPPLPSGIFIIGRESSEVYYNALKNLITTNLRSLVRDNSHIEINVNCLDSPYTLVHLGPYAEDKLKLFGLFSTPPIFQVDQVSIEKIEDQAVESQGCREELCFVALPGPKSLMSGVTFLNSMFRINPPPPHELDQQQQLQRSLTSQPLLVSEDRPACDYGKPELVGMRIIPHLSRFHSKKLCPLDSSDHDYSQAVQLLTDKPAILLIFRGVYCQRSVQCCINGLQSSPQTLEQSLQYIVSQTLSKGVFLSYLFFSGKELYSDPHSWLMVPYIPHAWVHESDILHGFLHPRDNLFSVILLPLAHMTHALEVIHKLSISGFHFAGISAVELSVLDEEVLDQSTDEVCMKLLKK